MDQYPDKWTASDRVVAILKRRAETLRAIEDSKARIKEFIDGNDIIKAYKIQLETFRHELAIVDSDLDEARKPAEQLLLGIGEGEK